MPLQLITPPEDEPVSLGVGGEAFTQLKLDLPTWEDKVALLVGAARDYLEKNLRRALVTQTWEVIESHFPRQGFCGFGFCDCRFHTMGLGTYGSNLPVSRDQRRVQEFPAIKLPKGRVQSVTSVKYFDTAGVEQTVDPSVYSVDTASTPGRVLLAPNQSWPGFQHRWDAVKVRYVVGWSAEEMPPALKQALLLLVSQMWTNDVPEVTGTIVSAVKFSFESLAGPYRIINT